MRRTGWRSRATARSSRSGCTGGDGDFALARYNPNGSLDTSFSGDGKQTTDFGGVGDGANGVALQARRQDRRGRRRRPRRRRLRARPLQPERLARHELLRRRQADDRLRGLRAGRRGGAPGRRQDRRGRRRGDGAGATSRSPATTRTARSTRASPGTASRRPTSGAPTGRTGWRSRATARSSRSARAGGYRQRLRARPLQPQRLARHELLRRRQADDRLRGLRRGERGGAPGRRQDRRGRAGCGTDCRRLRACPLQPGRLARRDLLGDGKHDDRLRASDAAANAVAHQATARSLARPRRRYGFGVHVDRHDSERLARHALLGGQRASVERPQAVRTRRRRRVAARSVAGGRRLPAQPTSQLPAQPDGSLDPTFSGDGKQTTDFGLRRQPSGGGRAPARRQDRRGRQRPPARRRRLRARPLQPDGSLDTSFSGDGMQTTDFGGDDDHATGVALQGDGKIVVVGSAGGCCFDSDLRARPLQRRRVARHELLRGRQANDRLRERRGGEGGGAPGATARSSRSASRDSARDFALARYNADGSLDSSFSGDGMQTTDFGGSDVASGVAVQGDGKIVVVGERRPCDFGLARYNPTARSTRASRATASRRPTSGAPTSRRRGGAPGGRQDHRGWRHWPPTSRSPATTPTARSTRASPATASRRPTSAAPTERTGWRFREPARSSRSATPARDFALARYNPDGSLDTSFSGDGKQTTRLRIRRGGERGRTPGRRQDRRGRLHCWRTPQRRLRARPLQLRRLARHELLWRRQAKNRLRGHRRGNRGGAPGATARSSQSDTSTALPVASTTTSRSPVTTRTARSTRASPVTASRGPTSEGSSMWQGGWRSRATARSW